ncbi:MAG: hypothetical protein WCW61_00705 [Patescibacteria group bacterium]|jgi:hypothetical protein
MFSYRSILKQSWNIAWKNKYLWLFGLFASIAAASGSFEYQVLANGLQSSALENSYSHINGLVLVLSAFGSFCAGFWNLFSYDIFTIINTLTVLIITLTLIVTFVWLSISSQAALVVSAKKLIVAKKKTPILNIRENLAKGHLHFWPVLGLNILIKVLVGLALFIMSVPLLFLAVNGSAYLAGVYVLSFIIFTPIAVSLSLIIKYAIAYNVLNDESFCASLKKSIKLFGNNWLMSVEMGIILFIISFLAGFLLLVIISIFIFPYLVFAANYGLAWLLVFLMFIVLALILFTGAILTTFQVSAWTDLFLELEEGRGEAKLERMFKKKA